MIRQTRYHLLTTGLVVLLASMAVSIQQDLLSGMSAKADEAGFIAAHPEGRGDP
jgi:hypothetical protein